MSQELTPEGQRALEGVAQRHGVSPDAALTLLRALVAGHGTQAQFSHPELGGMGQWTQGGMTMVGDMFNHGLKARVDAICADFAALLRSQPSFLAMRRSQSQSQSGDSGAGVSLFVAGSGNSSGTWWTEDLGSPSSTGAQNDLRYAFFPAKRRLAIRIGGRTTLYDTGDHQISGVSQQQSGDQSLTLTSQHGLVRVSELPEVGANVAASASAPPASAPAAMAERDSPQPAPEQPQPSTSAPFPMAAEPLASPAGASGDVFASLERLAELQRKGILSQEEFTTKKAELLSRI